MDGERAPAPPGGSGLLRWDYSTCHGTVTPLWVFHDGRGRVRLVDAAGEVAEELTSGRYHYRVLFATREEALRRLLEALRAAYDTAARELGVPPLAGEGDER